MAVEALRGCGYRKVGGLYLCGSGASMDCDRLPYELEVCPVCGAGVKFTRGWTWLNWFKYAGSHLSGCSCIGPPNPVVCPVCSPASNNQPYGLLWVGEQFYSPHSFIQEALTLGVSRRIAAIPKNLKLGETWVLFAHKKAQIWDDPEDLIDQQSVFYAFRPLSLELLIWKSDATPEKLHELGLKHITPIIIPDGDVDHDPRTSLVPKDEEKSKVLFSNMRTALGR